MSVQLVVASGSRAGQIIPVVGAKFVIGRADDCHLKPRSELISRYHCAIVSEEHFVAIRDLGSKNGVYLNGERVSMEHEIKNGDKLTVGPLQFFVHILVDTKPPKKPKIESVSQAVDRIQELTDDAVAGNSAVGEEVVSDWLLEAGDSGEDLETQTVDASALMAELSAISAAKTKKAEVPEKPGTGKQTAASSKEAASNLLKSFFGMGK